MHTQTNRTPLCRHNRCQGSELPSGSMVTFDQVSGVSSIDLPQQRNEMTEEVCCNTHYPVNPPVSAPPNSLELRALSPSLHCDNTAILGNNNLTAKCWQTGWEAVQIWKICPINAPTDREQLRMTKQDGLCGCLCGIHGLKQTHRA